MGYVLIPDYQKIISGRKYVYNIMTIRNGNFIAGFMSVILLLMAGCLKKQYSQDEFTNKVLGKPTWIVRLVVGKPDEINKNKEDITWIYKSRISNLKSDKQVSTVWLTVKEGKVKQVAY